ncbi:DUF6612 family protein [uncultured Flavonifractor sp.]|uniref:DUF6612 family protein n=1 Tax=uncultured Flavonifractor sp. TaxID=1193534 RepID=UPI002639C757|nr:DUF6612 family protein [uncultured Flavonifractor sp.]
MKFGRRAAALTLGGLLALSVTACGGTTNKGNSAEKIQAALEKINAIQSMDATMFMEMDMSAMGQSIETDTTMNMSCFNDPMKLKADMTVSMGELGAVSMSVYAQQDGEQCSTYLYDGTSWTVQTMEIDDLQQYDAQQSMDLYLESGVDYAYEGTEEINGMTTDKYSGVIRGDAMEEVMKASGATSNLESSLGSSVDLSDLYSDMEDMPITVWIDQETGYPVRYYMDMTDVMQAMMTKMFSSMGAGSITIGKMQITMDCFNFDNVADFEIPAEALAA